jgi:adenylate kinase family enzyme
MRLAACDAVIFLDLPPLVCLWRVLKRYRQFRRRSRPDMIPDCPEHLDWDFLRWICNYRKDHRPGILQKLAALAAEGKQVFILDTAAAVESFVTQLPMPPNHTVERTPEALGVADLYLIRRNVARPH